MCIRIKCMHMEVSGGYSEYSEQLWFSRYDICYRLTFKPVSPVELKGSDISFSFL